MPNLFFIHFYSISFIGYLWTSILVRLLTTRGETPIQVVGSTPIMIKHLRIDLGGDRLKLRVRSRVRWFDVGLMLLSSGGDSGIQSLGPY